MKAKGELISFQNTEGYLLNGILFESKDSDKTIIHIHGSYGNFYQAPFIQIMANIYVAAGYNFLSFNLTSHDGFAEGYKNDNVFEYVGGAVSEFNTCVSDIEGAVKFVEKFSKEIVLQGHSLGCDRIVHYLIISNRDLNFVLLAPCDSYKLQTKWVKPYTVEQQIKRLKLENNSIQDFDWLPIREYGVYSLNEEYILPITRKALLSIMTGSPFKLFNIDNPIEYKLNCKCFIYLGGNDNLQTEKSEVMFSHFKNRVNSIEKCFVEKGDHMLSGFEDFISNRIIEWLMEKK